MVRERRTQVLFGVLVLALSAAAAYRFWPGTAANAPAVSNTRGAARTSAGGAQEGTTDVHLEALQQPRPKPGDVDRNLFRFKSRPAPPPATGPVTARPPAEPPAPPVPIGPPPPPSTPPIPFKFIGVLEVPGQSTRVAILSDPRGVYHGREGDIIEGRYRILKIGVESVEMAEVDGRGRQTIRLSGQ
jgi:hypothetical protein